MHGLQKISPGLRWSSVEMMLGNKLTQPCRKHRFDGSWGCFQNLVPSELVCSWELSPAMSIQAEGWCRRKDLLVQLVDFMHLPQDVFSPSTSAAKPRLVHLRWMHNLRLGCFALPLLVHLSGLELLRFERHRCNKLLAPTCCLLGICTSGHGWGNTPPPQQRDVLKRNSTRFAQNNVHLPITMRGQITWHKRAKEWVASQSRLQDNVEHGKSIKCLCLWKLGSQNNNSEHQTKFSGCNKGTCLNIQNGHQGLHTDSVCEGLGIAEPVCDDRFVLANCIGSVWQCYVWIILAPFKRYKQMYKSTA